MAVNFRHTRTADQEKAVCAFLENNALASKRNISTSNIL